MKNAELNAKAEMMMMGYTQEFDGLDNKASKETAKHIAKYVTKVLEPRCDLDMDAAIDHILSCPVRELKAMNISTQHDMIMLAIIITTEQDEPDIEFDITDEDGAFGYVINLTNPDCSEFGYSFYERALDKLVRIG